MRIQLAGPCLAAGLLFLAFAQGAGAQPQDLERMLGGVNYQATRPDQSFRGRYAFEPRGDYQLTPDVWKKAGTLALCRAGLAVGGMAALEQAALRDFNAMTVLAACEVAGVDRPPNPSHAQVLAEPAASNGHARAIAVLGNTYLTGTTSRAADPARAIALYREAAPMIPVAGCQAQAQLIGVAIASGTLPTPASSLLAPLEQGRQQGIAACAYFLGYQHAWGKIVPTSSVVARAYFREAIAGGFDPAMLELAHSLAFSDPERDVAEAGRLLQSAVDRGVPGALENLANLVQYGVGMAADPARAAALFRQAAQQTGSANAEYRLGVIILYGDKGVPRNIEQGRIHLKRAADAGSVPAMLEYGASYWTVDDALAFTWVSKAAAAGHVRAMRQAGFAYQDGQGVTKDLAKALALLLQASDKGDLESTAGAAWIYQSGGPGFTDGAKAVALYRQAAAKGHPRALNNLGALYLEGKLVQRDQAEGLRLLRIAADKGNTGSMISIGYLYRNGQYGFAKDREEARRWFRKAAAAGNREGTEAETAMNAQIAREQQQAAQQAAQTARLRAQAAAAQLAARQAAQARAAAAARQAAAFQSPAGVPAPSASDVENVIVRAHIATGRAHVDRDGYLATGFFSRPLTIAVRSATCSKVQRNVYECQGNFDYQLGQRLNYPFRYQFNYDGSRWNSPAVVRWLSTSQSSQRAANDARDQEREDRYNRCMDTMTSADLYGAGAMAFGGGCQRY